MMTQPDSLRARLTRKPIVVAPGVYDAFTALVAEQAAFRTLYVSGAAIAYTRLGRSDIGLVSMSEVADVIGTIRDRVGADLIVDADTGYGNALNVARTVRLFERAGANAIQIEDQSFPKRCGHLDEKRLVPAAEMVGKIKAALDTRQSRDTLVIARTDAVGVEGFDKAIERALAYRDAGADMLFVEAPKTQAELKRIRAGARRRAADGQYGRRRQNAGAGGRRARSVGFRAGDLSRRHRARARADGERILRLAGRARHLRAVS